MNHASPSGNLMDKSGYGGCQENGTYLTALCKCKVWWRGDYGVGLFFRSWALPLSSSERNSECFSIPRDVALTLWKQFGDGPFLFQHDCAPVHKARSVKTWMSQFGVEELDWPAQSPDLNLIEHLWDELERRLRARHSRPTSVSVLTNALLEEW